MGLTARLGSMMPYRQAARVLAEFRSRTCHHYSSPNRLSCAQPDPREVTSLIYLGPTSRDATVTGVAAHHQRDVWGAGLNGHSTRGPRRMPCRLGGRLIWSLCFQSPRQPSNRCDHGLHSVSCNACCVSGLSRSAAVIVIVPILVGLSGKASPFTAFTPCSTPSRPISSAC